MKNWKRFTAIVAAGAMALTMAACGGSSSGNTDNTDASSAAQASSAGEAAAPGQAWYIGGIGPTTGGAASYGLAVKNGIQLAVDEINAAGGINGYPIEYAFQDDEHNAEKSVNAYNALKDWGMQLLIGTVTSTPCVAVEAEAEADNMFLLTPSGTSVDAISGANAFRLCFSDPNQGVGAAQYIGEHNLAKKIAVIYDSSDVYSSGIYEKFAETAKEENLEIVCAEAFTAQSNKDFTTQVQKAADAGAELVFLPIYYTEASLILQQCAAMDYAPLFFGCDGLDGLLGVENFDTSLAEGVMLLTPYAANSDDPLSVAFTDAYKAAFNNETPIQFAADAYDCVYAVKQAIEKAGATPDMSVSDLCEALKTAMTEITFAGVTGEITWEADGEPNKTPKAVIIENGSYKML